MICMIYDMIYDTLWYMIWYMIRYMIWYDFFIYLFTACPVTFSNTTCLREIYKYEMCFALVYTLLVTTYVHLFHQDGRFTGSYALNPPVRWVHKFKEVLVFVSHTFCYSHLAMLLIVHLYALIFPGLWAHNFIKLVNCMKCFIYDIIRWYDMIIWYDILYIMIWYMIYMIWYDMTWCDIFVNCNWVDTRW
jgi:hypothetical protein